ncbi:putative host-nuclease inhibitor protein [Sulfuriferula multivorans]|uniref:Putative host-nuclease inhibitor protein n=1 Tax=Sulfuriferula multivorans TaxID=1559896 RepID=A0A401JF45_9PROT|nr:host-nuclease inhibitor Gam family protein [Sulfuriferula multivorans]GBL46252.1 putative host-nuclease inhibitor protein [Sulfuriferula multivorans]
MSKRIKAKASTYVPQSQDDCAADIRRIGDLSRELLRGTTAMNDEIAAITERYQPLLDTLKTQIEPLQAGVQTWCEAHRMELTRDGKVKSANFTTGEVQWRSRPPSVSVRGAEAVIEVLKRLGLARFVRTKEEINKDAILNEPAALQGVAGISINSGIEDFVITPFEAQ